MRYEDGMMARHMTIEQLPYGKPVQDWLKDRYGETEANQIWKQTQANYRDYLQDLPDYGGSKKRTREGDLRRPFDIRSLSRAAGSAAGFRTAGLYTEPVHGSFYKAGKGL